MTNPSETMQAAESPLATYEVTLTHEDLEGPFIAEVCASSPERAAARIRHTAFHAYRHAPLLEAVVAVVKLHDGPPA